MYCDLGIQQFPFGTGFGDLHARKILAHAIDDARQSSVRRDQ